jgi:hypothetical protein
VAVLTAFASFFLSGDLFKARPKLQLSPIETTQLEKLRANLSTIEDLSKQLTTKTVVTDERVNQLVEAMNEMGSPQAKTDLRPLQIMVKDMANWITEVAKQSKVVEDKMTKLENVLLGEPLKAIELPLMKRVQSLQAQLERELKTVRDENGRVYDLVKWVVGLMGAVSLSLIGIAIGNIFEGAGRDCLLRNLMLKARRRYRNTEVVGSIPTRDLKGSGRQGLALSLFACYKAPLGTQRWASCRYQLIF